MTATQLELVIISLAALFGPLLVAVVAIIGLNRTKKIVLVLALAGLIFFLSANIGLRFAELRMSEGVSYTYVHLLSVLQEFGSLAVLIGSQAGSVGGYLSLIRTAQIRRWDWFAGILAAVIVSAIAGVAMNLLAIAQLTGTQRAFELLQTPIYFILTSVIFSVTFIAQLLYGIFGPDTPPSDATPEGAEPPTA